ncbi:MAG: hypothetical protein CMJ81_00515 [Planctomycetaceae bacterium]|nr:hypothetical protein [Planctomycetaceae bacterium]MBP62201.1 hypothetical protein [Planctomycetaceae bacterium]
MNSSSSPDLDALVQLFYDRPHEELGTFQEVMAGDLPQLERILLDHDQHMTLTIEAHHASPVDVHVLEVHNTETHYARKILLSRRSDGLTVQFGIVRLANVALEPEVQSQITSQSTPLGRILIQHNVLRNVRLLSLWKIKVGVELARFFQAEPESNCYGRTALIYCNGLPAVELLEIVRPSMNAEP